MPEKMSVLKEVINVTTTSALITDNIVTTGTDNQAAIKEVFVEATDPLYPISVSIENNGRVIAKDLAVSGGVAKLHYGGLEIIDINSSFDVKVDTGADIPYLGKMNVMIFDASNGMHFIKDGSTDDRSPKGLFSYEEIKSGFSSLVEPVNASGGYSASSAFSYYRDGVENYARCKDSIIYSYDVTGELVQTATAFHGGTVNGACADGTYFYGVSGGSSNILQRLNVSDGSMASDINLSQSVSGQGTNQGAYMLYYDGHVYVKSEGNGFLSKIDVVTGQVSKLTLSGQSGYSVGGIITVARDGTPYIVEKTGNNAVASVVNLKSFIQETNVSCPSLGTSTEYGNLALEVSAGIVMFFYNTACVWVDVNTMTAVASQLNTATEGFGSINSNSNASSIANLPLHIQTGLGAVPRATVHTTYAAGVKVTGV